MTCAKKTIKCKIVDKMGRSFYGENNCLKPQPVCPRSETEDYTKCRTICHQYNHAEINALTEARSGNAKLKGATAYIYGSYRCCKECSRELRDAGIARIIIEVPQ